MTKEECVEYLTRRAVQIEDANRLDKETGGIFCSLPTRGEIHIFGPEFGSIIDAMQPVVTYRPNKYSDYIEAEFTTQLLGKKYRVYSLLDRGGKRQ